MDWNLIWTALYGAICGYVASRIIGGDGYGLLGNIVVGVIGGFIGVWLVKYFNIPMIGGAIGNLVTSVGGALIFIIFLKLVTGETKKTPSRRR